MSKLIGDFDQVYTEHSGAVYRLCFRLLGNRTEAEDVVQDVFLAAFKGKERFRGHSSVKTWLLRIAFYRVRSVQEKRAREVSLDDDKVSTSPEPGRLDLAGAIEVLPPKLKEAFTLVKIEQLTAAEAAEVLQIPEGTVKYHVFEAIRRLRTSLSDTSIKEKPSHAM